MYESSEEVARSGDRPVGRSNISGLRIYGFIAICLFAAVEILYRAQLGIGSSEAGAIPYYVVYLQHALFESLTPSAGVASLFESFFIYLGLAVVAFGLTERVLRVKWGAVWSRALFSWLFFEVAIIAVAFLLTTSGKLHVE